MQSQEIRMSLSGHGKRTLRISQVDSNIQYFKKAMEEVGILLKLDESQTVLTQEQSLVIRDTDKFLKTDVIMNKVQKFISGFKMTCKQEGYFRKLLLPTVLQKHISEDENEALSSKINQESVFRILLNVSCLQTEIIEILLNEITTHAAEECSDSSLLRLLLNAVRYLPFIKEPDILTQKLLDVLDIATFTSQLEILNYIPEIIPDCHYDETAKQLIKLLDENADLTGAIIDCLNSFNLSLDTRANVQEYILPRLSSSTSAKMYFPVLFEFLITDCKPQQLPHILLKTRDALQIIMNNEVQDKNAESYMVIICIKIRITSVIKAVYDGWINIITNIRSFNSGQKPIDLLILFILHSSGTNRKKQIEALFKKKVKMSLFRTSHLEVMFQKYLVRQILHNHLPSIIEIATSLLMNNEVTSNEFANAIYKLVFTNAHIERTQRQDLLHSLMLLTGSSEMKNVYPILNILTELSSDPKLQQHTLQLMGLLEKLDTFDLQDCRQLFELLCTLICGQNADDSSLKNEIHMLIQKQLSSGKKVIKQRAIVSSVVMAKHIATTLEDQSALDLTDESLTNITNLPTGPPQESAGLLELASTCSSGTPELLGLYYDQLANIIMYADNIDKYFMTWLFESITQDFQDIFVIEKIPVESINDIKLESLFSLNTAEETDIIISINVAELTLKPSCARSSILILAPIFRLLRLLHSKHHNGDLATIDALLGCGIIMPNIADIESYDSYQMKQVSDCIFHCINWFREIISAFVAQTNKKLRLKVIERLNQLIELEQLLHKTMEHIPDHKLPTCNFYNTSLSSIKSSPTKSESKSRPKKKFKSNELAATNLNDTALTSASVSTQATKQPLKKVNADPSYNFREMDTDLIILIKYPLNMDDEVVVSETQQTKLEPEALQFILKDFIFKLNGLTKKKNIKFTNMFIDPLNLITDCTKLLPSINKHLEVIVNNISQILKETEFQMDHSGMYTPKSQSFKTLFGLILECLSLIFDWSGFQQPKHLNLLKECLKALRNECSSQLYSATQLTKEFINKLYGYTDYCLYLHSAVSLVKIMQSLSSIIDNNSDVYKKIALTSEKLLTKKWYNLSGNREGGKQAFENIEMLLKAYLTGATVKTIYELVATLQTQANNLKSKDDYLPMLGSIDKSSFHVFYRCLCSFLLERVKYEVGSLTNNEHIVLWRTTALTMQGLMTIVKVQEMRTNFCIFLKKSIGILKVFLSHGIPVLEIMLKSKTDEVVEILKTMQTSTRFLHHLCCYSKIKKDASLMANVPQFRLTLETFVFRVKAALVANDCSSAFWLGTLKNRDLQGDDISSQSTVTSEEAILNGNSDEELPLNDDDDDDEDIINETDDREDGTASEIFD